MTATAIANCPRCNAAAGEPCITAAGKPAARPHKGAGQIVAAPSAPVAPAAPVWTPPSPFAPPVARPVARPVVAEPVATCIECRVPLSSGEYGRCGECLRVVRERQARIRAERAAREEQAPAAPADTTTCKNGGCSDYDAPGGRRCTCGEWINLRAWQIDYQALYGPRRAESRCECACADCDGKCGPSGCDCGQTAGNGAPASDEAPSDETPSDDRESALEHTEGLDAAVAWVSADYDPTRCMAAVQQRGDARHSSRYGTGAASGGGYSSGGDERQCSRRRTAGGLFCGQHQTAIDTEARYRASVMAAPASDAPTCDWQRPLGRCGATAAATLSGVWAGLTVCDEHRQLAEQCAEIFPAGDEAADASAPAADVPAADFWADAGLTERAQAMTPAQRRSAARRMAAATICPCVCADCDGQCPSSGCRCGQTRLVACAGCGWLPTAADGAVDEGWRCDDCAESVSRPTVDKAPMGPPNALAGYGPSAPFGQSDDDGGHTYDGRAMTCPTDGAMRHLGRAEWQCSHGLWKTGGVVGTRRPAILNHWPPSTVAAMGRLRHQGGWDRMARRYGVAKTAAAFGPRPVA